MRRHFFRISLSLLLSLSLTLSLSAVMAGEEDWWTFYSPSSWSFDPAMSGDQIGAADYDGGELIAAEDHQDWQAPLLVPAADTMSVAASTPITGSFCTPSTDKGSLCIEHPPRSPSCSTPPGITRSALSDSPGERSPVLITWSQVRASLFLSHTKLPPASFSS